jgi:transketolase
MGGYGASGPEQELFEHFGITAGAVAGEVRKRL